VLWIVQLVQIVLSFPSPLVQPEPIVAVPSDRRLRLLESVNGTDARQRGRDARASSQVMSPLTSKQVWMAVGVESGFEIALMTDMYARPGLVTLTDSDWMNLAAWTAAVVEQMNEMVRMNVMFELVMCQMMRQLSHNDSMSG